jgi:hypothetical protein
MPSNLKKRVEDLEAHSTPHSALELKLQRFVEGTDIEFSSLRRVVADRRLQEYLSREMNDLGQITWPAFCTLRQAIISDLGTDVYVSLSSPAAMPQAPRERFR